jgi:hypothetical protein
MLRDRHVHAGHIYKEYMHVKVLENTRKLISFVNNNK